MVLKTPQLYNEGVNSPGLPLCNEVCYHNGMCSKVSHWKQNQQWSLGTDTSPWRYTTSTLTSSWPPLDGGSGWTVQNKLLCFRIISGSRFKSSNERACKHTIISHGVVCLFVCDNMYKVSHGVVCLFVCDNMYKVSHGVVCLFVCDNMYKVSHGVVCLFVCDNMYKVSHGVVCLFVCDNMYKVQTYLPCPSSVWA